MPIFYGHKPVISLEAAQHLGVDVESLSDYCARRFLSPSTVRYRLKHSLIYGFKQSGKWFIVTHNGEDLRDIY